MRSQVGRPPNLAKPLNLAKLQLFLLVLSPLEFAEISWLQSQVGLQMQY